jgi:CheY-like chemotaxis protein
MQKRLLLIDDDPDDVELFCEAVKEIGNAECNYTYNANDAIEFLKNTFQKPDYIFLDVNLPRTNGKQLLVQLKNNPQYSDIPVIIYTNLKHPQQIEEFYKLGASFYLIKPAGFEPLKKSINDVICGLYDKAFH